MLNFDQPPRRERPAQRLSEPATAAEHSGARARTVHADHRPRRRRATRLGDRRSDSADRLRRRPSAYSGDRLDVERAREAGFADGTPTGAELEGSASVSRLRLRRTVRSGLGAVQSPAALERLGPNAATRRSLRRASRVRLERSSALRAGRLVDHLRLEHGLHRQRWRRDCLRYGQLCCLRKAFVAVTRP